MDPDPDEEDMEDVRLDDKRERHWRMVLEDNYGGVDNKKALIYANMWYSYINNQKELIKGVYYVEVSGYDGNKFIWEVVDNHVVYIGIRGFGFF